MEPRPLQVDLLEAGVREVLLVEVSHVGDATDSLRQASTYWAPWGASHRRPRSTSTAGTPTWWGRARQGRDRAAPPRPAATAAVHQPARAGTGIAEVVDACGCHPATTLLDLACGRGGYGLEIAGRTGARLVGVDFSAEAVRQAGGAGSTGSGGRPTSAPATWRPPGSTPTRSRACCASTPSSSPSSPLLPTRSCAGSCLPAGGPCSPAGSRWTRLTPGCPTACARSTCAASSTAPASRTSPSGSARPGGRPARHVGGGGSPDPGDDPALQSFQDEGVRSLQIFDQIRRVLATATA